jgi:phospholipase C
LNPYRKSQSTSGQAWNIGDDGKEYDVDGIDDKLTTFTNTYNGKTFLPFKLATACVDDMSSDWPASFLDVSNSESITRKITMKNFVQEAAGYAIGCAASGCGSGTLTDNSPNDPGTRAMGYYDQDFLNYYYYMASQFAVSDRWFSPVASKSTPNRIATISGGTTQGLTNDPFASDKLSGSLAIPTIFEELDQAKSAVSWKIYYGLTQSGCVLPNSGSPACPGFPEVDINYFTYGFKYLNASTPCGGVAAPTTVASSAVGDPKSSYCIDPNHIAPITQYFKDVANGTLPNFAYIIPAYGHFDEHPGSGQSILAGQVQVAVIVNALTSSPSWKDSVFFYSYDEGGGPLDHVPPVPGHSNDFTDKVLGTIPDISTIAVNPDGFLPCPESVDPVTGVSTATLHCDLRPTWPGTHPNDAANANQHGFAAQLGFRLPNFVISPFTRRHFVSHTPMDHTAVLKFVESRFIGPTAHLTNRDAVQPDLLEFFDFTNVPWATPPTPPTPIPDTGATCQPGNLGTTQ